jgi:putative restriction endonuclease
MTSLTNAQASPGGCTKSRNVAILERFRSLSVWSKNGQRAPHKPLLCLLAISKLIHDRERILRFMAIEKELAGLLAEFGPPRKVCHPEYPFWCLKNEDGIWEVRNEGSITVTSGGTPTRATLLRCDAAAGFQEDVCDALEKDGDLRSRVIADLLASHFPETTQEDILQSLHLSANATIAKCRPRDSQFRDIVLSAYEYRCAVCGFNVRIGQIVIALEAAHIKWRQAGGPDIHQNGLALCSLHHKLFDRGAFTLDASGLIVISERAYGSDGFDEHLGQYHQKSPLRPVRESYRPNAEFTNWHMQQVFLSPGRE